VAQTGHDHPYRHIDTSLPAGRPRCRDRHLPGSGPGDRRRQWLIAQGLAKREGDRIVCRAGLLGLLRRRELTRVASHLSDELGLAYAEARPGERIEGTYRRRLDLMSGRYALIEKSREFTLVPWRPVLERSLGKRVSGLSRGETISWAMGRQKSGPSIS